MQAIILLVFLSEKLFPESPEHLASLAMSESSSSNQLPIKQRYGVLRLGKAFELLHGLSPSEAMSKARTSIALKLRESEMMSQVQHEGGGGCSRRYWRSLYLAMGVVSGFALSAGEIEERLRERESETEKYYVCCY
jgi:hypothetical protein